MPSFWAGFAVGLLLIRSSASSEEAAQLWQEHQLLDVSLECPITCQRFVDPVIAADGHTYERRAIEEWLTEHETSPLSGEVMPEGELRSNWIVKSLASGTTTRLEHGPYM